MKKAKRKPKGFGKKQPKLPPSQPLSDLLTKPKEGKEGKPER
jgi:hypothetical protein